MTRTAALVLALAAALAGALPVRAQDFATASGAGLADGAAALLEHALPSADGGAAIECGIARWFALDELQSRALAMAASWGSLRVAAGVAQAGEPEFGWNAAAFALGSAGATGGVALRVAARRERVAGALAMRELEEGAGLEAGAGGWLSLGGACRVWASAPQVVTPGEPPPLARALQLGLRAEGESAAAWAALDAPLAGRDGGRVVGGEVSAGPLQAWAEARDGPWRASIGVRAQRGAVGIALRVDAHPDLPETTFLWLTLARGRTARP